MTGRSFEDREIDFRREEIAKLKGGRQSPYRLSMLAEHEQALAALLAAEAPDQPGSGSTREQV